MENKNIVMLKRHFVNYKDPKTTTYYLNQCPDLAGYDVIDVTSHNPDPVFRSEISPMYIGPVVTPDGVTCNVFELLWQCSKVYPCHVGPDGEPTGDYFTWRNARFAEPRPSLSDKSSVKRFRHINTELSANHEDARYSLWYNKDTGKYDHLSYVQARKKIYIPEYARLVSGTETFRKLKERVDAGEKLAFMDYDAFNIYSESAKGKVFERYLDRCRKRKAEPSLTRNDFTRLCTMKDVIDCPFVSVGHGFILKALLQGDISVEDGEVIDREGVLC